MANISYKTAVQRLVEYYTDTDGIIDETAYLWKIYNDFRAEADRRTPAPIDWDFYLHGKTTDLTLYNHTQRVLHLFFNLHDREYVMDCYKTAKQAQKASA